MFGLFMLILFIAVWFASNINANNEVRHRKNRAKEKGQEFYLDRNGTMVDTKTDIPYDYRKLDDGDTWKVNAYTNKPIKNISEERRKTVDEMEKKRAIENGKTVYPFEGGVRDFHEKDLIQGRRYKDIKTGKTYVKRKYNNIIFLFNIDTCELERIDDGSKRDNGYWIYENGQVIKGINEQDIIRYCNEKYIYGSNDKYGNLHKVW